MWGMESRALKVVYAGTPEFAKVALDAVVSAGYQVACVLTQPDRPAGRGMKLQPSVVKTLALKHGIGVLQPTGLKLDGRYAQEAQEVKEALEKIQPDVMVVAAYGLILPQWLLDLPRLGCLNIHASLLPRWRGAAPIHRAIEAGDRETGVTIMQMDAGLDTGDMLLDARLEIMDDDTTASLHDKLAALGGALIVQALDLAARGELHPVAQPQEGVCYANKIDKSESRVDWLDPAHVIERRIRAFDPFPGVATQHHDGQMLKIWRAYIPQDGGGYEVAPGAVPGTVLAVQTECFAVLTGDGVLVVTEMQRPGGKRQPVREFLQAVSIRAGDVLS